NFPYGAQCRRRWGAAGPIAEDEGWGGGPSVRRLAFVAFAVLGCCPGALAADLPADVPPATAPVVVKAPPSESGRFTLIEENDALAPRPTDRWYTQGIELNYLSAPITGTGLAAVLPSSYLDPGSFRTQRFELVFGQSIFTPENVTLNPPD